MQALGQAVTREDAARLLTMAEMFYGRGGTPMLDGSGHPPDEWYGAVLSVIEDSTGSDDGELFRAEAHEWGLDTKEGLRALVRLSASAAVAKTLRYLLGVAVADCGCPVAEHDVVAEMLATGHVPKSCPAGRTQTAG
jgi:hypothetical protein